MIGYVTLGTNNREKANAFFDTLFAEVGIGRLMDEGTFVAWGTEMGSPALSVTRPFDGNPATAGNGTMIALVFDSRDKVDRLYNKAIELGSKCEGPPGERMENFYAAYFRDLDGNKLSAFCHGPA